MHEPFNLRQDLEQHVRIFHISAAVFETSQRNMNGKPHSLPHSNNTVWDTILKPSLCTAKRGRLLAEYQDLVVPSSAGVRGKANKDQHLSIRAK